MGGRNHGIAYWGHFSVRGESKFEGGGDLEVGFDAIKL